MTLQLGNPASVVIRVKNGNNLEVQTEAGDRLSTPGRMSGTAFTTLEFRYRIDSLVSLKRDHKVSKAVRISKFQVKDPKWKRIVRQT